VTREKGKNKAASIRARLLALAQSKGEDYQRILGRFAIERFLYRLGRSPYRDIFAIKGATLFTLWTGHTHRPTKDLDLLGRGSSAISEVEQTIRAICGVHEEDGIAFHSESVSGVDPEWLVKYIDNAWEPTRADLETLMVALAPHYAKFKTIYQPIRHQVFAHKSIQDDKAIVALFEKTLITDVHEILRFLHTLFWAIWEMAWNGKRPDLADFRSFDGEVKRLINKTEEFIRGLP